MTRFKLVPVEPTEEMVAAGAESNGVQLLDDWYGGVDVYPAKFYRAMLQAAPEPSPEMVDELCKAMWGHMARWAFPEEWSESLRDGHRIMMLAFLQRIGEQK
jgi:hypothetical protein